MFSKRGLKVFSFLKRLKYWHIRGKNNQVLILKNGKNVGFVKGLELNIKGNNNRVVIHVPQKFRNVKMIVRGNNNFVEIKESKYFTRDTTYFFDAVSDNRVVKIGKDFLCAGAKVIVALDNSKLRIGNDCMFSYELHIRNHDGHVIYDKNTKEALKYSTDIILGDHVWLGYRSMILRGVNICSNVIIGAGSIVTKDCLEEYGVYAGVPAKIKKSGVNWSQEREFR